MLSEKIIGYMRTFGTGEGFYSIASTSVYNGIATKFKKAISMENTQLASR